MDTENKGNKMSPRFASTFIALIVGLCLHASSALAQLSVTATQATGAPGSDVNVTLTISAGAGPNEVNLSAISAYTFNFLWDPSVLIWNSYTSGAVDLSPAGSTLGSGSAVFDWFDSSFSSPVSFAGGLSITASFHILNTAAYGASTIYFGDSLGSSILADDVGGFYSFPDANSGNPQTQVTVLPTSPIPEPAEVSMLMAGLGIMALVLRRRKNQG